MKITKRYLPLWVAIAGYVIPLILVGFGFWYGVWIEDRTSGDGPNNIVWTGLFAFPVLQLCAIFLGIRIRRTVEGKLAVIVASILLLGYIGYWFRWWL